MNNFNRVKEYIENLQFTKNQKNVIIFVLEAKMNFKNLLKDEFLSGRTIFDWAFMCFGLLLLGELVHM